METEIVTAADQAEAAIVTFKRSLQDGHPWVPGSVFIDNPGLDLYVVATLEKWAEDQRSRSDLLNKPA